MMPVMDGFEFLEHFKKLDNAKMVPVIVVTAKDLSAKERESLASRVSGIVDKDKDYIDDLIRNVGMAIGGQDETTAKESGK
jgi:CheY-like chemotaxis protein